MSRMAQILGLAGGYLRVQFELDCHAKMRQQNALGSPSGYSRWRFKSGLGVDRTGAVRCLIGTSYELVNADGQHNLFAPSIAYRICRWVTCGQRPAPLQHAHARIALHRK